MKRRDFVKSAGILGAAAVLPKYSMAQVKGSDKIKFAIIGCGGRGMGAVDDLFRADQNTQLVAMADLFEDRLVSSYDALEKRMEKNFPGKMSEMVNVPKERRFSGFDAYKKALECDVDVVILAAPAIFREPHMRAAIMAKKHVFAEKPFAVDIVSLRKMYDLPELAEKIGVSVISGTQRRYHTGYLEAYDRVKDGQIGDIVSMTGAWLSPAYAGIGLLEKDTDPETVRYQIRNFFCFIWACGDFFIDQTIHCMDVCRWFYGDDKRPAEVIGYGGRNTELPMREYGSRYTNFTVDYSYENGVHLTAMGRQQLKSTRAIFERIVGTKGVLEMSLHPEGQRITGEKPWEFKSEKYPDCLALEHAFLLKSIREGKPVNRIKQMLESNLMAITGRQAAYSGMRFKYEWTWAKSQENFIPENLHDLDSKLPLQPTPNPENYRLV